VLSKNTEDRSEWFSAYVLCLYESHGSYISDQGLESLEGRKSLEGSKCQDNRK